MTISQIIQNQKTFFDTNKTKDVDYRIEQLKKIKIILKSNEPLLNKAIQADFSKSEFQTYVSELLPTYFEIDTAIKNLKNWSKFKRVSSGLLNFPAKSYIIPEPLGVVLVIGPWNYPYQLSLVPAISALAAGNTVILKPSELPSQTSAAMAGLINTNFDSNYFYAAEGGIPETTELLENRFDKIFFTGSTKVGKIVYQAAAKHLTPVTLELGGKCPTFIFADCNMELSVKRLVWAKFLNAGQTCVSPDYILVEKNAETKFLEALKKELEIYPKSFENLNGLYSQIIDTKNFDRVNNLINMEKVFYGGITDKDNRFISPTIITNVTFNDPVMQDEIFGPILPVIPFSNLDEIIKQVKSRPKPLACYIYSKNSKLIKKILHEISFGGGAVNDSFMQLTVGNLPFGGVGQSGFGSYHGKYGFDTFSHFKSILHKPLWFEPDFKYAPYSLTKLNFLKRFIE